MTSHPFLSDTRRVLAALPMTLLLLTGTGAAMAQVAPATPTKSSVNILISGTVLGAPEAVTFSNAAVQIGSTLSRDADPAKPPVLIVDINFLQAIGIGSKTGTQYLAEAQVTKLRPFKANEIIEVTFPFTAAKSVPGARSGRALFHLTFDTNGGVTGAAGTIGANPF